MLQKLIVQTWTHDNTQQSQTGQETQALCGSLRLETSQGYSLKKIQYVLKTLIYDSLKSDIKHQ